MDEVRFGQAMKALEQHSEMLQRLVDEARARITHPSMEGVVLKSLLISALEDIDYHSMRLIMAAQELRESVDRRSRVR